MPIVEPVISNVITSTNGGNWYNSGPVLQNAFNLACTTIYERHRDTFEVDQKESDYLQELYQTISPTLANPLVIPGTASGSIVDLVKQVEVKYGAQTLWQAVQYLPDNNYTKIASSLVIPPSTTKPIMRLNSLFTYEILPVGYTSVQARVLCLPITAVFELTDNNSPIPDIDVTTDSNYTEDKIPLLTFLTMTFLSLAPPEPLIAQFADQWAAKIPGQ